MIKKLEWTEVSERQWSSPLGNFGWYLINQFDPKGFFIQYITDESEVFLGARDSLESAKALAQGDWNDTLSKFYS